jgi:hypothetical protein
MPTINASHNSICLITSASFMIARSATTDALLYRSASSSCPPRHRSAISHGGFHPLQVLLEPLANLLYRQLFSAINSRLQRRNAYIAICPMQVSCSASSISHFITTIQMSIPQCFALYAAQGMLANTLPVFGLMETRQASRLLASSPCASAFFSRLIWHVFQLLSQFRVLTMKCCSCFVFANVSQSTFSTNFSFKVQICKSKGRTSTLSR